MDNKLDGVDIGVVIHLIHLKSMIKPKYLRHSLLNVWLLINIKFNWPSYLKMLLSVQTL